MKLGTIARSLLVVVLASAYIFPAGAGAQSGDDYVTLPFNVSLVPGVSVGDAVAKASGKKVINNVALSLIAGRAARLNGVEWAGLASLYSEDVRGAQFSGLANLVGGGANAAQFAGLLNIVSDDARVAQFGGVLNITGDDARGAQFAGLLNVVADDFVGAQFAGTVNLVGEDLAGAQFGGLANVVGGESRGLQIAPANVASEVRGVQIGVVNVAEEHTGVPIGLVSYVRNVGLRYDLWVDETGMVSAAVRTGNRLFSNHLGVSVAPFGGETYFGLVGGIGMEVPIAGDVARFGFDLLSHGLSNPDLENRWMQIARARAIVGLRVIDHLEVFGGPTFNVLVADQADRDIDLVPWSVYDYTSDDVFVQLWPGFNFGIRVF